MPTNYIPERIDQLFQSIQHLYQESGKHLIFHGWHHIHFVYANAIRFADAIGANKGMVAAAALLHDLNYLVESNSQPEKWAWLRTQILSAHDFTPSEQEHIESIILESHTATRNENISPEWKSLSDADTAFKALPTTPILFASKYIHENNINIAKLAKKITSEQNRLMETGIYFYTDLAKQEYFTWAQDNLTLWNHVMKSLDREEVQNLLHDSGYNF